MRKVLRQTLTRKMQKIFWIYLTNNFIVNSANDLKTIVPVIECGFIRITLNNYFRVRDFREENRISEYREKLTHKEIGYFAEHEGIMIGSIWATINKTDAPTVVRTYMRLMPNEGLIHDIVTGDKWRGLGVGPFMVSRFATELIKEYRLNKIIIDVNFKNQASLHMMVNAALRRDQRMLYVSMFGKLALQLVLKRYN
jgi:hypothetical protein